MPVLAEVRYARRVRVGFTLVLLASCVVVAGCGRDPGPPRGSLRAWKATDHQPPESNPGDGRGPGTPDDSTGGDPTARAAAALWTAACASCHGPEGRGDGAQRPPGANVRDLTAREWQTERTDAQIAEVITAGRGMMPPFGERVTAEGIAALVQHVRTLGASPPR